ncbi:MAG: acyl-homoserine-lactone synthase [Janthinobacterium lividum]
MIYAVQGTDADRYPKWMAEMHRLRARVFRDRMKWDVVVKDGREIDGFDSLNPLYLLSIDPAGSVVGTLRLLPTTGPNMLRDVFPELLSAGDNVESPTIWESSRFAVDLAAPSKPGIRVNQVTTELLCGIVEIGMIAGLSMIVSVFDAYMLRVLRSAGYGPDLLGTPKKIGSVMAHAGLFDVSEEAWQRIAAVGGVRDRVFSPDSDRPARAA